MKLVEVEDLSGIERIPSYEKGSRIEFVDFDDKYIDDMTSGLGFDIDVSVDYDTQISKGKLLPSDKIYMKDSIYSYKFGIKAKEVDSIPYLYRCKCGDVVGRINDGFKCEKCDSYVKKIVDDVRTTGWITVPPIIGRLPSPMGLAILKSAIGTPVFTQLLSGRMKKKKKKKTEVKKKKKTPKLKYKFVMLQDKEIMRDFLKQYGKKKDLVKLLLDNHDTIFSSHIPVITEKLRPNTIAMENGVPKLTSAVLSAKYTVISKLVYNIGLEGTMSEDRRNSMYQNLIKELTSIDDILAHLIGGDKGKFIKDKLLGNRLPYTARGIIIPNGKMLVDQISLPIITVKRIFKPQLIELMKPYYKLHEIINILNSEKTEPKDIEIIRNIILSHDVSVIINRQPTLNISNLLCMKVADINDHSSVGVNPSICGLQNLDFDGDSESILPIPFVYEGNPNNEEDARMGEELRRKLSPRSFSVDYKRHVNNRLGTVKDYRTIFFRMTQTVE